MKTENRRRILLLVSALTVLALSAVFAVVASAWTEYEWGEGYILYTEPDGNGGLYIDINFFSPNYMVEDEDLHDGYWFSKPVPSLIHVNDNGVKTVSKITATTVFGGKEVFWLPAYDAERDTLTVENITKREVIIDETFTEDHVFEPDGHHYIFRNASVTGHVVILNTQNDYTRVFQGAPVDVNGKILDYDGYASSRWADVGTEGSFVNFGTLEFLTGKDIDAATNRDAISFVYKAANNHSFMNFGTINIESNVIVDLSQSEYRVNASDVSFYNAEGATLKIGHNVFASTDEEGSLTILTQTDTAVEDQGLDGLTNDGEILCDRGRLVLGDSDYKTNLVNTGTIRTNAVLQIYGALRNAKSGTIELYDSKWINVCNGTMHFGYNDSQADYTEFRDETRERAVGRLILQTKYIDDRSYVSHVNSGKIFYDGDYIAWSDIASRWDGEGGNRYFIGNTGEPNSFVWFANCGQFINRGVFSFKTSYLPGADKEYGVNATCFGVLYNEGKIENETGATFEVIGTKLHFYHVPRYYLIYQRNTGNIALFGAGYDDYVTPVGLTDQSLRTNIRLYPCSIRNDGTMILSDLYSAAEISNNGDLTVKGKLEVLKPNRTQTKETLVYDDCGNCPGHNRDVEFRLIQSDIVNNGFMATENTSQLINFYNNGTYDNLVSLEIDGEAVNNGTWTNKNNGLTIVYGSLENNGILDEGTVESYGEICNNADMHVASVKNAGTFEDAGSLTVEKRFDNGLILNNLDAPGLLLVSGSYTNHAELHNGNGSDIRVEGELDNVNGHITNDGMIVNVGMLTTMEDGIDNRFAIHGYDVTYVTLPEEDTKADDDETDAPAADTKAPDTETKAPDTQAPNKQPAAQTSDIAVAGFAVLATLTLAGVGLAKKVR